MPMDQSEKLTKTDTSCTIDFAARQVDAYPFLSLYFNVWWWSSRLKPNEVKEQVRNTSSETVKEK
jgi:hypothetical protein